MTVPTTKLHKIIAAPDCLSGYLGDTGQDIVVMWTVFAPGRITLARNDWNAA